MKVEVLVSTMNQKDHCLIKKMNLSTDAIIINQCDVNCFEEFEYNNRKIRFISLAERGIGLSRNNALMRATGDICLFADDDLIYMDNYTDIVMNQFEKNPDVDILLFNVSSLNRNRPTYTIKSKFKIGFHNCMRFGAVNIAAKTEKVKQANIFFSLLFGGGAKYSSGEDTLFVIECLKKGLKIVAVPDVIGSVTQKDSTWFNGHTDKYFFDKGVLYTLISKTWSELLCLQFCIRHSKMFSQEMKWIRAYRTMLRGTRFVKENFRGIK